MVKRLHKSAIATAIALIFCALAAVASFVLVGATRAANAEEQAAVTLNGSADFVISSDGVLTGLSDSGKAKIADGKTFEVVIPEQVITIASKSFSGLENLVKVSFAANSRLETIADADKNGRNFNSKTGVFANCTSLKEVVLPQTPATADGKLKIGAYAFYKTVFTSVDIPAHANDIAALAFSSNVNLTDIRIAEDNAKYMNFRKPDGTPYNGNVVYVKGEDGEPQGIASCTPTSIKALTLPASVVESETFDVVLDIDNKYKKLETIDVEENTQYRSYGNALYYKATSDEVMVDGYSVNDCAYIPCNIKVLGIPKEFDYAWDYIDDYGDPSELSSMLDMVEENYPELESITVEEGNPVFCSLNGALYNIERTSILCCPPYLTELTVSDKLVVTSTTFNAYWWLESVVVDENNPDHASYEGVLYNKQLSEIEYVPPYIKSLGIAKNVTSIDKTLLSESREISSITVDPDNTVFASYEGILYDKALTEVIAVPLGIENVYIPASVTTIGEGTFEPCLGIRNVYVYDLQKWCEIDFYLYTVKSGSGPVKYRITTSNPLLSKKGNPTGGGHYLTVDGNEHAVNNTDLYVMENGKWTLQTDLNIDFDGELNDAAFIGCGSITSVSISDRVTRIGAYSFAICPNLTSITLPYVGEARYFENDGVKDYNAEFQYIYGGAMIGGVGSFSRPRNLKNVTVDGGNEWRDIDGNMYYGIPASSFSHCAVTSYKINLHTNNPEFDGVAPTISLSAFSYSAVQSLDLGMSGIKSIGGFAGCDMMTEVILPDTLETIELQAFLNCSELKEIIIPDGVKNIYRSAFDGCKSLVSVRLPSALVSIEGDVFDSCTSLKTVYITGTNINHNSFPYKAQPYDFIAIDEDVYRSLPIRMTEKQGSYTIYQSVYYMTDVRFELYDPTGKLLGSTTERHLAAWTEDSAALMNYRPTATADGAEYWAQDANYKLPTVVGEYAIDPDSVWVMNDKELTATTALVGKDAAFTAKVTASAVKITPQNIIKQYDGKAWALSSDSMTVTNVTVIDGGNGYRYSARVMPQDVGTYTVTVKCNDGYEWSDAAENASAERTFTLEITPVSVKLEWYYMFGGEQNRDTRVTGAVPEREYNGKGTRSYMRAEFTDVNGDKQTADYRAFDLFMFGDRETTVLLRDVGLYEFVLNVGKTAQSGAWLGNYEFENSVQQFRITPYSIDLNDYNNLAWGLPDFGSALRDGGLYIYNGKPYMYEQQGMGAAERRNVVRSVARFRNVELNVGITVTPEALYGSGNQYTATLDGVCSAKEIGIYTAIATLKVKDGNYKFVYGLDVDLWSRGMKITLNADGTATVEKVWYIVGIDNGMLDADGNEYRIVGWTYGDDVTVAAPRLEHGDEADDFMSNSNIRFELIRNKVSVVKNLTRSNFAYYINKSMPSGDYELVCTVIDVTVGSHTHWWNGEVHDGSADADVVYHGFERTLVFTVADAAIAFTLETDDNNKYAAYEWEYNAEDKAAMFASFTGKLTGETVGLVSVTRDGYWATTAADAYYGGYKVEYNLLRMHNDSYYTSDKLELLSLIGKPDRYVVYFNVIAPNHAPLTDLGEARYDYFFTVDVYTVLALPALESSSYAYTGEKIIPVIATSDLYSAEFDEDDDYINAGTHSVKFTLNDGTHYRWVDSAAVNGASVTVKFEITQAVNAWIETPDVVRWTEGKYDAKENKFIGAAKFGEIKYIITDSNDNVVYDSTKNINKLASLGAGTYIIKATVKGNDNYNGLSEAFTMRVLEKSGMPWWVILVVVLGVLLIVALVIFILWKKGVFTVLTDKLVLSIRTRATVDATIAAVRANKAAEQAQLNIAKAKAEERAAERKAKAEEERAKPAEEKAAALEEKAKAAAERAEKMRAKSEAMRARAERLRAQAIENEAQIDKKVEELKAESAAPQAEAAATEVATNESVDAPSEE